MPTRSAAKKAAESAKAIKVEKRAPIEKKVTDKKKAKKAPKALDKKKVKKAPKAPEKKLKAPKALEKKVKASPSPDFSVTLKGVDVVDLLRRHQLLDLPGTILDLGDSESDSDLEEVGQNETSDATRVTTRKRIVRTVAPSRKVGGEVVTDVHKVRIKMWLSGSELHAGYFLPPYTGLDCWWHRAPFTTRPWGCPLRYHSPITYTKDEKARLIERFADLNFPLDQAVDFFEIEGVFCSKNCTRAYALDQLARTKRAEYREALTLITVLDKKLNPEDIENEEAGKMGRVIKTAPTWKALERYNGWLTDTEFQELGDVEYAETPNRRRPLMFCSATYVQEMSKR